MKTKNLVRASILLALGTVLHFIIPGIFNGMKPDFLLVTMFIAIIITDDIKSTFVIAMAAGVLTAMTTSFPGGQVPSIIDKLVSAYSFYFIYNVLSKRFNKIVTGVMINVIISTIISGITFILSAILITGFSFPGGIKLLIVGMVIPTAIFNGIFGGFLLKVLKSYKKAVKI